MKKSLVSALTTALVVGAASTTFAAANPFSDVPADHWAYDAVAQLAAEGVVDGYGDGSYRGEQEITRYEMAQMVAKAMAKGVSSATLDKLAAEFADELNQLGVRVAALEKKVDNVKFTGEMRYRAYRRNTDARGGKDKSEQPNRNQLIVRLNMKAQVNEHWTVNARMEYDGNNSTNAKSSEDVGVNVDRMWAEGQYGKTNIKLGKFNYKTFADYGLINDRRVTGAQVITGNKIQVAVTAGRYQGVNPGKDKTQTITSNYMGIEVFNKRSEKFTYGIGYHNLKDGAIKAATNKKSLSVWALGAGYKFNKSVALEAAYARSNASDVASKQKKRMAVTLKYKGANAAKRGSYGLFAGYRHIGAASGMADTYSVNDPVMFVTNGFKGWEFGADYTLDKNILLGVRYFMGKELANTAKKPRGVMAQVEMFF